MPSPPLSVELMVETLRNYRRAGTETGAAKISVPPVPRPTFQHRLKEAQRALAEGRITEAMISGEEPLPSDPLLNMPIGALRAKLLRGSCTLAEVQKLTGLGARAAHGLLDDLKAEGFNVIGDDRGYTLEKFQPFPPQASERDDLPQLISRPDNTFLVGATGDQRTGRDTWKRPEMGRIADEACEKVILTNEDPYDEDPRAIVDAMAKGMRRAPEIIMDRREAIRAALRAARANDVVLISGKGTDPFIMGARGTKIPWSDALVIREELERLLAKF